MSPSYKIYYFDGRGRAEISRMILSYAGIPFEDIRYTHAIWPEVKAHFPGNQVPCLEIDGKKFSQSLAIARYLARETGLYGKTTLDGLKIDGIVDSIMDLVNKVYTFAFHAPPIDEAKAALWTEISTVMAPRVFTNLDKCLEGPYFIGNEITMADLAFVDAYDTLKDQKILEFMAPFPRLAELQKKIAADPKVAAYLAKRPKSEW